MNANVNLFDNQESFGGKYSRINTQTLSNDQKDQIDRIEYKTVSKDGMSFGVIKCFLVKGGAKSFYANKRNNFEEGDLLDKDSLVLYNLMNNETGELSCNDEGKITVYADADILL